MSEEILKEQRNKSLRLYLDTGDEEHFRDAVYITKELEKAFKKRMAKKKVKNKKSPN